MPEKILLVDEQLYMLRLIEHHLSRAGYELITARNSEEARVAMETARPTLVVGDMKTLGSLPCIPSIGVTDDPITDEPAKDGQSAPIVFQKPFSPTQLVAEVKRLIPQPSPGGIPL